MVALRAHFEPQIRRGLSCRFAYWTDISGGCQTSIHFESRHLQSEWTVTLEDVVMQRAALDPRTF